ncbi:hypothetical protein Tco_1196642 [Tanacetum coccineum]
MTTTVINNSGFRAFFEKQKLSGPNFIDWYRQLRIVLSTKDKLNYLDLPIPAAHIPAEARQLVPPETLAAHAAWVKELKTLFSQQAEQEFLQIVREFYSCKQKEGQYVSSYVLNMKSYTDNLERMGHPVSLNLAVSLILVSLQKEYDNFVQNYNMHGMGKTGFRRSRKLKPGALSLYMGNGQRAVVEAIRSYDCVSCGICFMFYTHLSLALLY